LDAATEAGGDTHLIDLREYDLPLINPDVEEPSDARELTTDVRSADAVLLGTPVYKRYKATAPGLKPTALY